MPLKLLNNGEYAEMMTPPIPPVDVNFSGVITVTTAGTPITGSDISNPGGFWVQGEAANTKAAYVFPNVTNATAANSGACLPAGQIVFMPVTNLNQLKFDAGANGEKVRWWKA